jgi:serralysin
MPITKERKESNMSGSISVQVGTADADIITAKAGESLIAFGLAGNDTLTGAELTDFLFGATGDDVLVGNAGNDFIDAGEGADNINTGAGDDLILAGPGNDTVGGMAGHDTVFAGDGDDLVAWNDPTGDIVFGEGGNDILRGGDVAADTIFGGDGDDLIRAVANQGLLTANAPDFLYGDAGNDAIVGGNGADFINGGTGNDVLAGSGGADQFAFLIYQSGKDTINDFEIAQDVVVLAGFPEDFNPLDQLTQGASGAELDLGGGNSVVFFGKLVNEFGAGDFRLS